jgi:hypothetical protein
MNKEILHRWATIFSQNILPVTWYTNIFLWYIDCKIYSINNMQIYYCIYTSNISRQENWNLLLYKEKAVLFKMAAETKETKNITNSVYHPYNDVWSRNRPDKDSATLPRM